MVTTNTTNYSLDLSGVEETALLTLYTRAIESKREHPILKDLAAEKLVERLDPLLRRRGSKMARQLSSHTIDPKLTIHIPLRSRKYDMVTSAFLERHPAGVVVNIGCGMDTRFLRIDNGQVRFFDLDLPEIIRFKRRVVPEQPRYRMITQSVLDHTWMDQAAQTGSPVLFLAEGVFMYLPEDAVRRLVLELRRRFPGSELVCELTSRTWVEGFWGRVAAFKMRRQVRMGCDAAFHFGVNDARDLEAWAPGIALLEKWFYMDDNHPRLGWVRHFRNWKVFRNSQFTARYCLGAL
jgi:methyltransferase (TIGR00027 family)